MKIALITGGSRGIGAATAQKFAKENYTVVLNYHKSATEAEKLCKDLSSAGCDVHPFRADVADCNQVFDMFTFVQKYFKHLDVLVNNAGVALYKQCQDVSEEDFDTVMDINAKGAFFCCREAVKMFLKQGYGSIVNVSSLWGIKGASCESVYSMSKHAILGLTKSLAEELRPSNIRVNCVCPTIVQTDMCAHLSQQDVRDFCAENAVEAYSAEQVAKDIFNLAESDKTAFVLQE